MKLKPILQPHIFHYFRGRLRAAIYDSQMDEPICQGSAAICDAFVSKYLPTDSTIYYYAHDDNFSFVFQRMFVGTGIDKETAAVK